LAPGAVASAIAKFAMAGCEMTEDEFTAFPRTVLGYIAAHSVDGSIHFVLDWRHM
jgi:hypothetical protein